MEQAVVSICTGRFVVGRDNSVGIATGYGLDGPGIESRWEARFSAPVQTRPGVHPDSYTMGTLSFQGVKQPGHGFNHPPPPPPHLSPTLKKKGYSYTSTPPLGLRGLFLVELYLLPAGSTPKALHFTYRVHRCARYHSNFRPSLFKHTGSLIGICNVAELFLT